MVHVAVGAAGSRPGPPRGRVLALVGVAGVGRGLRRGRGAGVRLGLAGLVVVLVGLDQGVQDPGEFAGVAGG